MPDTACTSPGRMSASGLASAERPEEFLVLKVKCPVCGREVEYSPANPHRPFCSERCRLIDLGAWANDEYVIEGEPGSAMSMSPEDYDDARRRAEELREKPGLKGRPGRM